MSTHLFREPTSRTGVVLHLFGGPFVTFGTRLVDPPEGSKRLLALLALRGGRIERHYVAHQLWPGADRRRADGNLRTALWRLHGTDFKLIDSDGETVGLHIGLTVDVHIVAAWANRINTGRIRCEDLKLAQGIEEGLCVLPGWYDDWVVCERERLRCSLLDALEMLSRRLSEAGRYAEGIEAALIAVAAEPLRESAHRALIEAHLSEGNLVEARRAHDAYRDVLHRELGVPAQPWDQTLRPRAGRFPDSPDPSFDRWSLGGVRRRGNHKQRTTSSAPQAAQRP